MSELWITVHDLPAEGREFSFTDQDFWIRSLKRYGVECRPAEPLKARYHVQPKGDGYRISGELTGKVIEDCDRCAEDAAVEIVREFDIFEEGGEQENEAKSSLLHERDDRIELDVGGMLWEQFLLALPVKPLCDAYCRGLCPQCGRNLNTGECECEKESGDPRMAIFRNLKLSSNSQ
jgi:uncharacterized protein